MEFVPFLFLLFLFLLSNPPPIRCEELPLDGPDPEVDEYIRKQFQSHADAFSAGMKDGWAEEIKKQTGKDGGLEDLVKPENVAHFVTNWLPERVRALLPKELLIKLIKALSTEGGAIAQLYAGAENVESGAEFRRELKKKAPQTAELLEEAWEQAKERWAKFNGMLNDEAKQYVEKVKDSGWRWFVRQVVGPFVRLPNDAKTNLTLSLFSAFPLISTVMSKLMANRALLEWAGEWYKKAEEQIQTMEKEKNDTKEELSEDGLMAQMKEMFKNMNLGNLKDLMGGMGEGEDEEEIKEAEEQLEEEEEEKEEETEDKEEEEEEEEKIGKEEVEGEEEKEKTTKGEEERQKEEEEGEGERQCGKSNDEGQCMAEENAEESKTKTQEERDEL